VKTYVQANLPQYASLPVLSVSAPFKSGFGGGSDYTDVAPGAGHQQRGRPVPVSEHRVCGEGQRRRREELARDGRQALQHDRPDQGDRAAARQQLPGLQLRHVHVGRPAYEIDVTSRSAAASRT
jgi:hypothetical protein